MHGILAKGLKSSSVIRVYFKELSDKQESSPVEFLPFDNQCDALLGEDPAVEE